MAFFTGRRLLMAACLTVAAFGLATLPGRASAVPQEGAQFTNGFCKGAEEWKSRSIYFLMTDRFARTDSNDRSNCDWDKWCGGTFVGLKNRLSYIKGMGFDAIWISPIMQQVPDSGSYLPYHGYHAANWYEINRRFGTIEQFNDLLDAADKQGIWVMLDLALNHMGGFQENIGGNWPFDRIEHYHHGQDLCNRRKCLTDRDNFCAITNYNYDQCNEQDAQNVEDCRLASLPDLDQDNPWVISQTENLFTNYLPQFNISGYRLDAIKHMPIPYLKNHVTGKTDCFTIGEALFPGKDTGCIHAKYQEEAVDGVLDFSLQSNLKNVFGNGDNRLVNSMEELAGHYKGMRTVYKNIAVNGLFLDNHDKAANGCRWLGYNPDDALFKNALTYVFTGTGIPILYYGTEQGFNDKAKDGDAPCRRPMWVWENPYNQGPYYQLVAKLNNVRKACAIWKYEQTEVFLNKDVYVFRRGDMYVILTNQKLGGGDGLPVKVRVDLLPVGTRMCNAFFEKDCVQVFAENGQRFLATKLIGGEAKVFAPVGMPQSTCGAQPLLDDHEAAAMAA